MQIRKQAAGALDAIFAAPGQGIHGESNAAAVAMVAMGRLMPGVYDWMNRHAMYDLQMTDRPANADPDTRDNLYAPKADGAERGRAAQGRARETSLYTQMQMHPWLSWAIVGGAALLGTRWAAERRRRRVGWW